MIKKWFLIFKLRVSFSLSRTHKEKISEHSIKGFKNLIVLKLIKLPKINTGMLQIIMILSNDEY